MNHTDFSGFTWINKPQEFVLENSILALKTEPRTDLWQRTYYGFQNDNAHAFILPVHEQQFTFNVKTRFEPARLFDQCGIVMYQDSDNWFKASVEYDNEKFSRLGSVVTNLGYSDWASVDSDPKITTMVYRLSRRGQDFLVEHAEDGLHFQQMRIFHMHQAVDQANIGVYACSPLDSSFTAAFFEISIGECIWEPFAETK
jgi:uncharacterized protein